MRSLKILHFTILVSKTNCNDLVYLCVNIFDCFNDRTCKAPLSKLGRKGRYMHFYIIIINSSSDERTKPLCVIINGDMQESSLENEKMVYGNMVSKNVALAFVYERSYSVTRFNCNST